MLKSTIYVSHSLIGPARAEPEIEDLVAASILSNARRAITGALLYTGTHFAQILEGPPEAVLDLMQSIIADLRHERLAILLDAPLSAREFDGWSLAYRGPSLFMARNVERLWHRLPAAEEQRGVRWLTDVMKDLAKG